jgi:hypothetical protein
MMSVQVLPQYNREDMWRQVRLMARGTVGLEESLAPVSEKFKREMIASLHSPIREFRFVITFRDLPTYAAQQMSRHRIASLYGDFLTENINPTDVEHYVKTQRPDRTGAPRGSQNDPVTYRITTNVQGLYDMSQKRLCFLAESATRSRWGIVRNRISELEPWIARNMVPTCVARGFCPEAKKCAEKYDRSMHYQRALDVHRGIKP